MAGVVLSTSRSELEPCLCRGLGAGAAAKNATEILLDSVDYFTILLTGISGIFVNNLPLSFSTALAHSAKPPNAKIPGLFRYFFGKNLRNLRKQSTSKNLAFFFAGGRVAGCLGFWYDCGLGRD